MGGDGWTEVRGGQGYCRAIAGEEKKGREERGRGEEEEEEEEEERSNLSNCRNHMYLTPF